MTQLGKPLVFHLKYMAEMNRLYGDPEYEGGEPDLTGVADAEQVRAMLRTVGLQPTSKQRISLNCAGEGLRIT